MHGRRRRGHLKDHRKPRPSVHPWQRKHPTETADITLKSSKRRTQGRSRPTRCQLPATTTDRNCQKLGADSFARSLAHSTRNLTTVRDITVTIPGEFARDHQHVTFSSFSRENKRINHFPGRCLPWLLCALQSPQGKWPPAQNWRAMPRHGRTTPEATHAVRRALARGPERS